MSRISVAEAADRLDVNVQRIHQRIADGSLAAERVGHQWVIDEADVLSIDRRGAGRPLSARSAWALVAVAVASADPGSAADRVLSAPERSRARARLRQLLQLALVARPDSSSDSPRPEDVAAAVRGLLKNRARRIVFRCSPRDLADLRLDGRVKLSGISHPAAGVASGDAVEGYVASQDVDALVADFLLTDVRSVEANVILHVGDDKEAPRSVALDSWLVLAADLAEHHRPRESARAAQLVSDAAHAQPELLVAPRSVGR